MPRSAGIQGSQACLTALLPLEIHHLVAMILGAAGYMFLQQLEPSVRRREPVKAGGNHSFSYR